MDTDALAAVLAIFAAAFFALAATLWQKASLGLEGISIKRPKSLLNLLTRWVWLAGLGAQVAGIALQAAALDRGRVAVIQPLLVTTIIWAIPLGYFLTGQKIVRREVIGAAVCVAGLAVFSAYGDPSAGVDNAPASDWASAILVIGAICGGLALFANRGGSSAKAAVYGTIAGILYGLSATLMKPVVETWHADGAAVFGDWELWAMVIAAVLGFVMQQISLSSGQLVASVTTVSVANPIVSVMLGVLILQERLDDVLAAAVGLALALFGAVVIASIQEKEKASPTAPATPGSEPASSPST